MKTIAAAKFKAQCLSLMDEVQTRREPVLVTKKGKPAVMMVPLDLPQEEDPLAIFRYPGLKIVGDITEPLYTDEEYEQFFQDTVDQLK